MKYGSYDLDDLAKYPEENPNPVIRISKDNEVLYSNESGRRLQRLWDSDTQKIPLEILKGISDVLKTRKSIEKVVNYSDIYFLILFIPIENESFVNLYCTDITKQKEIEIELFEYKEKLEEKVLERTSELLTTQRELKDEIRYRKVAEKLIQESEDMYRVLTDNIHGY